MSNEGAQLESRMPHRLAVLLVCVTFPLIWVGGLVTSTRSGMAVPDWPTTYGYNLFLYPWQTWLFGPWDLFIEHGHRLLGALVGMITIALVVAVFVSDSRRWIGFASLGALALVVFQGVLGGLRVRMDQQSLAMIHGCTGPLFFGYAVAMAVFTSSIWRTTAVNIESSPNSSRLHRLALMSTIFAYIQLTLGAQIRHVRPDASSRVLQLFVVFHIVMAIALLAHAWQLKRFVARHFGELRAVRGPSAWLANLVMIQILLGVAAWIVRRGWPVWFADFPFAQRFVVEANSVGYWLIPTIHTAMGSLILVTGLMAYLRAKRFAVVPLRSVVKHTLPRNNSALAGVAT